MPEMFSIASQRGVWLDPSDWHNHTPIDLREYIFERVVSKLLRSTSVDHYDDLSAEQFSEVAELAKWIESQSFNLAESRSDYYRLLDIYLNKTHDELKQNFEEYKEDRRRNLYLVARPIMKSWHQSFSSDLRKVIISTFVDEIISANEQDLLHNDSKQRLLMLASRSEVLAYETATSRAQYYEELGKKISEIKYRIDTLMEQVRGLRGTGITSSAIDMISQPSSSNEEPSYQFL